MRLLLTGGSMTREELILFGRTAVHLKPAQVAHRARLRAQRTALRRWPQTGQWLLAGPRLNGRALTAAPRWPAGFTPLDATALTLTAPRHWPSLAQLGAGRMQLLGITRQLGDPPDWQQSGEPLLWRFHLHYWDWAWGLAADPDRAAARTLFARLWRSWQESCPFGHGDAWLPYPAALRAWSWCGLYRDLVKGTDLELEFLREIVAHAAFVRRHLESDIGGNHLIKDLKALAGLGIFLSDEPLVSRALRLLTSQLAVQVLPDGGHYERAPAYHCQVLADLIDVADLLNASGRAPAPSLTQAIARMRRWLGAVLTPDGAVPLLNDGYPVPSALVAAARPRPAPAVPLLTLPDTGLIRAAVGGWHMLADVGAACPDELPGHAHADTLSCLVHVDGVPLLVDTGTSTYEAGPVRSHERSTAAHNTVEIDGMSSTEVWGAFRAARRARVHGVAARSEPEGVTVEATQDGYRRLPGRPVHHRRWSLTGGGLQVHDEVTGGGRHTVIVRWHLAPGSAVRLAGAGVSVTSAAGEFAVAVTGSHPFRLDIEPGVIASGFQRTTVAPVLVCSMDADLPARLCTSWCRTPSDMTDVRRPV